MTLQKLALFNSEVMAITWEIPTLTPIIHPESRSGPECFFLISCILTTTAGYKAVTGSNTLQNGDLKFFSTNSPITTILSPQKRFLASEYPKMRLRPGSYIAPPDLLAGLGEGRGSERRGGERRVSERTGMERRERKEGQRKEEEEIKGKQERTCKLKVWLRPC